MECARLILGSASGNHLMFIGGLNDSAPCSGRGTPLYPGQAGEREIFIENSSRVRVCATFSGELIYYMGFINGQPTSINPSTQGVAPNNQPPILLATDPISGQHNVNFSGSDISFVSIFNENIASGSVDTSSYTIRLSGDTHSFLSGEVAYHQPDDDQDRSKIKFTPYSGQLIGSSAYNVFIGSRVSDDPGSTIPSTLIWGFVTAGIDPVPMVLKSHSPISGAGSVNLDTTITAIFNKAVSGFVNNTGYGNSIYIWKDSDGPTNAVSGISVLDDDTSGRTLIFTPDQQLTPLTVYRYSISGVMDSFNNIVNPKSGIAFSTITADLTGPVISGIFVLQGASGFGQTIELYEKIAAVVAPSVGVSGIFNGTNIRIDFDEFLSGVPGAPISGAVISLVNSGALATQLPGFITLDANRKTLTFNPDVDLTNENWYQIRVSGVRDLNNNVLTQSFPQISGVPFRVWGEPDVVPPSVNFMSPFSGTVGNSVNIAVVVQFSEPISGTAGDTNFTPIVSLFLSGTGFIAGTTALDITSTTVTFTPNAALSGDRDYYTNVSGAYDLSNNQMNNNHIAVSGRIWRTVDNIPPVVSGINPISGFADFNVASDIVITFSEAISGTANGAMPSFSGVVLYLSGFPNTRVAGSCTLNNNRTQLSFNPTNVLTANEHYQVGMFGLGSNIRDVSGNQLTHPGTGALRTSGHSFKTQSGPIITATNPTSGATNVGLNDDIIITFDRALSGVGGTANAYSGFVIQLLLSGQVASAHLSGTRTLNAARTQITYNPIAALTSDKIYVFAVSGVMDTNGALITQIDPPRSGFAFTTQLIDTTPPTIQSTVPTSGVGSVAVNSTFVINFSETISGTIGQNIMPGLFNSGVVAIALSGHNQATSGVAGTAVKTAATQITFTPSATLSGSRWYRTYVSGVYDLAQNVINQSTGPLRQSGGSFQTIDNIAPTITTLTPANTATDVNTVADIVAVMSELCSGDGAVTANIFTLVENPNTTLGGSTTATSDSTKTTFTFNPSAPLNNSKTHTLTVANIRDRGPGAGNTMTQSTTTFTTAGVPLNSVYNVNGTTASPAQNGELRRIGIFRSATASSLNQRKIKRAAFALRRVGNPTCTVRVVIRQEIEDTEDDNHDNEQVIFDTTYAASEISTTGETRYTFEKLNNTYGLSTNDAIMVEFVGGTFNGSNHIVAFYNGSDQVDGADTRYVSRDDSYNLQHSSRDTNAQLWE